MAKVCSTQADSWLAMSAIRAYALRFAPQLGGVPADALLLPNRQIGAAGAREVRRIDMEP
ncbi:hypothetical protein GCM10010510_50070 [Streptomyces anandii JCM 4720]|nr:hypothetical protein GCM10010510_50070 [Streptomyces anandii JCM 4720]